MRGGGKVDLNIETNEVGENITHFLEKERVGNESVALVGNCTFIPAKQSSNDSHLRERQTPCFPPHRQDPASKSCMFAEQFLSQMAGRVEVDEYHELFGFLRQNGSWKEQPKLDPC